MASSENSSGLSLSVLEEILNPALLKKCEVVLICEDQKIPTNRIILQMASPVFRKMFEVNMTEKSSGIVNIKDVDPEVMKMVIDYYENGKMIDVQTVNHRELYKIIEKYDFQAIKFGLSARIISQFTGDKLMKAYELLRCYGTKENLKSTASEIGRYLALKYDPEAPKCVPPKYVPPTYVPPKEVPRQFGQRQEVPPQLYGQRQFGQRPEVPRQFGQRQEVPRQYGQYQYVPRPDEDGFSDEEPTDSSEFSKHNTPITKNALDLSEMSIPDLIICTEEFNRHIEVSPHSLSARREFAKTCVAMIEQSLESKEVCTKLLQTLNYESFDIDFFKEELFGRQTKLTEDALYSIIQVLLPERGYNYIDRGVYSGRHDYRRQNLQDQSTESKIIACLKGHKKA